MIFKSIFVTALVLATMVLLGGSVSAQVECGAIPEAKCRALIGNSSQQNADAVDVIRPLVEWVTNILIGLFGTVAVLIIIISGVQISASAGNEEIVKKGKENIFKVVTGLILLISFRAIISLIDSAFVGVDTANVFDTGGNLNSEGIPLLLNNVIGIASLAAGVVSVVMIIVGAIQYIGSGGGDGLVKAKKTITYAISGLVISILAYTIVTFINGQLQ